ncbi:hypothetical protein QFZ67_000103 [Streptomyces sp. V1I1]|nr:hypothetical protein [Streptomyces sp. V1I1]
MGEINVGRQHLNRLLADSAGTYGAPYQRAFAELAETHRGRPTAEILPLLRRAATRPCSSSLTLTCVSRPKRSAPASRTSCVSPSPERTGLTLTHRPPARTARYRNGVP